MGVIGEVLVRVTIWFKFQENPDCLGMNALLSSMLEVFTVWDPDTSCQTWLESRKYTEIKFLKSGQGMKCSGFQEASSFLSPLLGVVSLS